MILDMFLLCCYSYSCLVCLFYLSLVHSIPSYAYSRVAHSIFGTPWGMGHHLSTFYYILEPMHENVILQQPPYLDINFKLAPSFIAVLNCQSLVVVVVSLRVRRHLHHRRTLLPLTFHPKHQTILGIFSNTTADIVFIISD